MAGFLFAVISAANTLLSARYIYEGIRMEPSLEQRNTALHMIIKQTMEKEGGIAGVLSPRCRVYNILTNEVKPRR